MYLVKTLLEKIMWDKNLVKEKSTSFLSTLSPISLKTLPGSSILLTSCSKVFLVNGFVARSSRFSREQTCWTFISPFFWRSWVKNNLGKICFILSPFMYHFFQLSNTCNIVFTCDRWCHFSLCWAKFSTWLADVHILACFTYYYGIIVTPHVNLWYIIVRI